MNKTLRILIAVSLLAVVLFFGRDQMARGVAALVGSKSESMPGQGSAAGMFDDGDPGSVKPPPVFVLPITGPGDYAVGGVCTFHVFELSSDVTLHANLLPYATLGIRPQTIAGYLAGVCRAMYTKVGSGVIDLTESDGRVEVCFAAIPDTTGKLYVYNDKTWTALDTTTEGGLACGPAQQSGKYVLVTEQ